MFFLLLLLLLLLRGCLFIGALGGDLLFLLEVKGDFGDEGDLFGVEGDLVLGVEGDRELGIIIIDNIKNGILHQTG